MNLYFMEQFAKLMDNVESIHFYNELLLIGNGIALLILVGLIITLLIHHKTFLDQAVHENEQERRMLDFMDDIISHMDKNQDIFDDFKELFQDHYEMWKMVRDQTFDEGGQTIDLVREWHRTFGVPVLTGPQIPSKERADLRIMLIKEELDELNLAYEQGDLTEILDAFMDLQYVLDGAMLEFGFYDKKHKAFLEVHKSNMSKLGANGKPIKRGDGKILKGPNFNPPELEPIIEKEV